MGFREGATASYSVFPVHNKIYVSEHFAISKHFRQKYMYAQAVDKSVRYVYNRKFSPFYRADFAAASFFASGVHSDIGLVLLHPPSVLHIMLELWQKLLQELSALFPQAFEIWFKPITPVQWNEKTGELTLAAPTAKVNTLRHTYKPVIDQLGRGQFGIKNFSVTIISLGASETKDEIEDDTDGREATAKGPSVEVVDDKNDRLERTGLLPGLTFENYVHGNANQLAVAAAEHVATSAGGQYNPLYIYGGVGLGKTHLMQAIGHRYLDLHPRARVRCVSAQDFINEFAAATRESGATNSQKALQQFDERYRTLDLLLIDDVQSFSGAKGSQAQFFRTFEALVPHSKQLVLTSDTYTKGLKDIAPRLISRLTQGLTVAIEPPEFEMRIAILLNKAKAFNIDLPEEVATFIAKRLKSNVRELEGALQQVIAFQQFQPSLGKVITIDVAKRVLRDQFSVSNNSVTIENIQKTVADYYKIKVADMYSKRRPKNIALPRQIAMYLAKELTQHSLPEIGANFGGRDHTTVMHAVRKIAQERKTDADLNHELHVLKQIIIG